MNGLRIIAHSIGMLVRNLDQVLRLGLLPMLITTVVGSAILLSGGYSVTTFMDEAAIESMLQSSRGWAVYASVMTIYLVGTLWIIVSWHRFVLLEEYPRRWLPPFRFNRMLAYLGNALRLGFLAILAIIPILVVLGILIGAFGDKPHPAFFFMHLLLVLVGSILFYRVIAILPAAAIGKPLKLRAAWAATQGATGAITIVVFLGWLINFLVNFLLVNFLIGALVGSTSLMLWPLSLVAGFLTLFFNASLLTTIYGHYIEGRALGPAD